MSSRFATRSAIVAGALARSFSRRRPTGTPSTVLVAHHPALLGDAFMLAPLLAKLRHIWPQSRVVFVASPATARLFEGRPWGIDALAYDIRNAASLKAFKDAGPYDLAIVAYRKFKTPFPLCAAVSPVRHTVNHTGIW